MNPIKIFRFVAIAEAVSFLILLCIAMPLKYYAGFPEAVKFAGMMHGLLFVAYIVLAWETMNKLNKNWNWFLMAIVYAIIPLGAFYMEKKIR